MDDRESDGILGLGVRNRAEGIRRSWRALATIMLNGAITAVVLGVCVSKADLNAVVRNIAVASPAGVVLASGWFLRMPAPGGLRWWIAPRAIGPPAPFGMFPCLFSVVMIFGLVVPSLAGDGFHTDGGSASNSLALSLMVGVFAASAGLLGRWAQQRPEFIRRAGVFAGGA
ncbi:MAG TPA: hypothetical protein VND19_09785 [Acetobacteraceae bacterium]|nr:hypothetical protein [Acetobacteraceae bacterium]